MLDRQRQPLMRIAVKRRETWEWSDHTQGDEPEYPPEQVEIMSDHHLRTILGLHDGDMLEFTLLTDQGTGKRP
jgi:hypothetical protein